MSDSPAGKTDKRIDRKVPFKQYSDNWDLIYNKDKNNKDKKE